MVKYRSLVVAAGLGLGLLLGRGDAVDLFSPSEARADREAEAGAPRQLAAARRAVDELRFDRAQELLGEALREGHSSPATMLQIYELAASTAVVLGKEELAELYYRRLLCIDPKADLEAGLAPKFKRPFSAARAYVNAHGALRVRTRRLEHAVEIYVESDPLAMVAAVALGGDEGKSLRLDPSRRAVLPLPADDDGDVQLLLVDEFSNRLQIVQVAAEPAPEPTLARAMDPSQAPESPGSVAPARSRPSLLRTWWIWTLPAAASLGLGVVTGLQSQQASDDLDELLSKPNPHYDEAEALQSRSRSRATIANLSFGAAGLFTAVAIVMLATRPDEPSRSTALAPMLGEGGAFGLTISGTLPGNF